MIYIFSIYFKASIQSHCLSRLPRFSWPSKGSQIVLLFHSLETSHYRLANKSPTEAQQELSPRDRKSHTGLVIVHVRNGSWEKSFESVRVFETVPTNSRSNPRGGNVRCSAGCLVRSWCVMRGRIICSFCLATSLHFIDLLTQQKLQKKFTSPPFSAPFRATHRFEYN